MPPTAAAAYQSLQDFNSNRTTPDAAISTANNKYGVDALGTQLSKLRGLTSNLQTSIGNVDPSVRGRTEGSLVTEAQRQAITNNEQAPLVDQFNKVSTNLNNVDSQYKDATGLAGNYANSLLSNDQNKYQQLFGQYTALTDAEQKAAALAEQKREADLSAATARSTAAGLAGLSSGFGGTAAPAVTPNPNIAAGTAPKDAVAQLFRGYQPGAAPGYTENTVIPTLIRYLTLTNPKQSADVIKGAAANLAYNYRKTAFGE